MVKSRSHKNKDKPKSRDLTTKKSQKIRGWIRFLVFLILILVGILILGFFIFAHNITTQKPPKTVSKADGIVVLTGSGGGRLEAAAKLLRDGYGERLLISGVNQENRREDVLALLDLPIELAECCVDFDYAADTVENAKQTAAWTKALAFEHIILVTSAYHMPRSQVEISGANGRIKITPYPVIRQGSKVWWRESKQVKRLTKEYGKLLLSYVRDPGDRAARKPIPLEPLQSPLDGVASKPTQN